MSFIILILGIFVLLLVFRYPLITQWLCIYFISNPGGVSKTYLSKEFTQFGIDYVDIFAIAIFILSLRNNKSGQFFNNKIARQIFYTSLLLCIYRLVIYGWVLVDTNFVDYFRFFIIRERWVILGFLMIIPIYSFVLNNKLKPFIDIAILVGIILLILVLFSMLTGIEIITIKKLYRYEGTRLYLRGYGFLFLLIPVSIIVYLSKMHLKYRKLLYIAGGLAVILIIVSITKGLYLILLGLIATSTYCVIKILRKRTGKLVLKIIGSGIIIIVALNFLFPLYASYTFMGFGDIFLLATEKKDSEGDNSRWWQVEAVMYNFRQNPILGTGESEKDLSKKFSINQYDASDFPLIVSFMRYGILGFSIFIFILYLVIKAIKNAYLLLKHTRNSTLLTQFKYEYILIIASIAYFGSYFFKVHSISYEFYGQTNNMLFYIYVGILLGCTERLRRGVALQKNNSYTSTNNIRKDYLFGCKNIK